MRTCVKCGEKFAGHGCLACKRKSSAAYREKNREATLKYKRAYNDANREMIRTKARAYGEANRDAINARSRARYAENPSRDYHAEYRTANRDRIRENGRRRYAAGKDLASLAASKDRHPERHAARMAVNAAIRRGDINRPVACPECKATGNRIEAHHPNGYGKAHILDVVFLCSVCHGEAHRILNEGARGD